MYPTMIIEVIEAIETHFCNEPDVMVDCMLRDSKRTKPSTHGVSDVCIYYCWDANS